MRCVRFAAVSSKPQAREEKDSIPKQLERQAKIIEARDEWAEVHEPLIVPGHTRSIDFLHEAIEEIPAIADLIDLARSGEIDVVLCRDYDRLSRTRALLPQLSTYLARCHVQIYALNKPVEPVPPEELDRRGRSTQGAATVEAFAGLISEGEISRIVNRHYDGLNALMKRGKWKHSQVAFGYTRLAEHSTPEQTIYTDVPRQVPEEVSVVQMIERLYLEDGKGASAVARQLNAERIPSRRGKAWQGSQVLRILKNPFYCGYIVWGVNRVIPTLNHSTGHFQRKSVKVKVVADLEKRLGRTATVFDFLDHVEELERHDIFVVKGYHEPMRTDERQREIYAELARRRWIGGRGASVTGDNPNLFTGIIFCECGSRMLAMGNKKRGYTYYRCYSQQEGLGCTGSTYAREDRILDKLLDIFYEIVQSPNAIDDFIELQGKGKENHLRQERDRLGQAIEELGQRRQRWDDAYEVNAIDLADYTERVMRIVDQQAKLEEEWSKIERRLSQSQQTESQQEHLLELISHPPTPGDRGKLKAYLRQVIEKLVIRDGKLVRVKLRLS